MHHDRFRRQMGLTSREGSRVYIDMKLQVRHFLGLSTSSYPPILQSPQFQGPRLQVISKSPNHKQPWPCRGWQKRKARAADLSSHGFWSDHCATGSRGRLWQEGAWKGLQHSCPFLSFAPFEVQKGEIPKAAPYFICCEIDQDCTAVRELTWGEIASACTCVPGKQTYSCNACPWEKATSP